MFRTPLRMARNGRVTALRAAFTDALLLKHGGEWRGVLRRDADDGDV